MAWNLDYTLSLTQNANSNDGIRMLSGGGKIVWAILMTLNNSTSQELWAFDAVASYSSIPTGDEDLAAARTGNASAVTRFQNLHLATIASDGDTCYAGVASSGVTTTNFSTVGVFNSWGVRSEDIKCPVMMNSNIVVDNGGLWMVSYDINYTTGVQDLYRYDLTAKTWSSVGIPVKHQNAPHHIARDHDGHILHCDFNNLSISKFTNTGTYVSTTRLAASAAGANRQPNYITVGDDRQVYIASFQGMISKFDPNADTVTSFTNGLGDVHSFVDDGTYLWVASEKRPMSVTYQGATYTCFKSHMSGPTFDIELWAAGGDGSAGAWTSGNYYIDDGEDVIRITKSNNQIRHFGSSDRDIQIENPAAVQVSDVKVNSLLLTPSFSCATKDGVVSIPKLVWVITDENKVLVMPTGAMFRPNYYQMNAVAMMSYGPHDFIGE